MSVLLSKEKISQIQELCEQGCSMNAIRRIAGVSCYAVYRYGHVKSSFHVTDDMVNDFRECRRSGMTCRQIAEKFGVSKSTVFSYTRKVKKQSDIDYEIDLKVKMANEILTLYRSGLSQTRIAGRVGCSITKVHDVIKSAGHKTTKRYKPDGGTHRGTVRALYRAGWPVSEIAKELESTEEWVNGVVNDIKKKEGIWYQNDEKYWKRISSR